MLLPSTSQVFIHARWYGDLLIGIPLSFAFANLVWWWKSGKSMRTREKGYLYWAAGLFIASLVSYFYFAQRVPVITSQ